MGRFQITRAARADVREILAYISKQSPQGERIVRRELRRAMELLGEFPGIGHNRADVGDITLRFWSVFSYLIAYRTDTRPIQIVRVIHGARDLGPMFPRKS